MEALEVTRRVFRVLETGDADLANEVFAPEYVNHAAAVSPPACQRNGPPAALATGTWLHHAYNDLSYSVIEATDHDDQVWSRVRMYGTHTGPFVRYLDGRVDQVLPPTGRKIDVEQFHVLTLRGEQVIAHEALRDDLGMIRQLGLFPPRLPAIARVMVWRISQRAAHAARVVTHESERAADSVLGRKVDNGS